MQDLLRLRAGAAVLQLHPRGRSLAELAGAQTGARRGRGIEFEEVRAYQAGDDVRAIDWRVTARTGKTHTRMFREERERPVLVLVDQRQGMFFGSRRTLKSVQAVHAAALLAWATLAGGDRIGGIVLGDADHHEIRPQRDRHAALELLRTCHDFNHRLGIPAAASGAPSDLGAALASMRRVARPGTLAILISDFAGWTDAAQQQLQLLARHAEPIAIHVYDPLEEELPGRGRASVSDGSRRVTIDAQDAALRERYRAFFAGDREAVKKGFARVGAPLLPLATDTPALEMLMRYFRKRPA
jgi:uncharacterized protein (DUF58 family)